MGNFNINGKVFLTILVFVIAISGLVFGTTIIGTSGSNQNAVPTYKDKVVAATVTSFTAHVSQGHQAQVQSSSNSMSGSSKTSTRVDYAGRPYKSTETQMSDGSIHVHNEYTPRPTGYGSFYGT